MTSRRGAAGVGAAAMARTAAAARAVALAIVAAALAGGCFTFGPPPLGEPALRPSVQHSPQNQVVGDAVVASAGDVAITVEPLSPEHLDLLFQNRPGLVNPLKGVASGTPTPLAFRMTVRNRARQPVQIEPAQFTLTDQEGLRAQPMQYQDFYQLLADMPDAEQRLRSVQATTFSSFLTVPAGGEREGFIFFAPMPPESRLLILQLGSVYLGARELPLLAEFEVVRTKAAPAGRK